MPRFVPFSTNLAYFGGKSDIPGDISPPCNRMSQWNSEKNKCLVVIHHYYFRDADLYQLIMKSSADGAGITRSFAVFTLVMRHLLNQDELDKL